MQKSWNEIRKAATAFSKRWKDAYDEKSQAQSFLKEFFAVFGVDAVTVATFEHRVKFADGSQGYADCFWQGKILVEMKSRGKDLDAAYAQALDYVRSMTGTTGVSPVGNKGGRSLASTGKMPVVPVNAQDARSPSDLPRAIVVSDFARVRFYDLANDCALTEFALKDLRKYVTLFGYMIGDDGGGAIATQDPVNRKAAEKMARLHDAMKAVGYTGHPLEVYLVRLLFCLFAEDTGIFKPDQFSNFVRRETADDGRDLASRLAEIFGTLNAPPGRRLSILDEAVAAFPYVNGGLFAETLPIAAFSADMRKALLDCGALDWSKISPAIFGAMFQGVMDEKARHDLGAHYTDEEYILRVIRPLFLDALRAEFEEIVGRTKDERQKTQGLGQGTGKTSLVVRPLSSVQRQKLLAFHEKIAALTFLDPACGCGNFLLIAYRELRRLEMDVLEELYRDEPNRFLDISELCKVSVSQFYGIEIEPFPAEIAKVALWLMDHLCNMEVADRFGQYFARIPIKDSPHIVCANALTMDWGSLLAAKNAESAKGGSPSSATAFSYIFGNPPFLGRMQKGPERQAEIALFFDYKDIDYVACWYAKAAEYAARSASAPYHGDSGRAASPRPPQTRCAFVSTNSITQGEQVAPLWRTLGKYGTEIDFAWQTFKWHNEAKGVAAVHCVIIGFHTKEDNGRVERVDHVDKGSVNVSTRSTCSTRLKTLYNPDGTFILTDHINGYLMPAPDVFLESRPKPKCPSAPGLTMGNMPLDGGNLIIEAEDLPKFAPPAPHIKQLTGSKEYIQGLPRWCLWLKDIPPEELRKMPLVMERVAKCREWRLASKSADTRKHAATPALFREQKNPKTAIIIPKVSSEKRDYIPMGFIDDSVIVTDLAFIIPDATLYHLGVLMSRMHNVWARAVGGRMKSDYRYSKDIVYNNFIWPEELLSLRGDSESRSSGENSQIHQDLQASKTPSSESNSTFSESLRERISQAAQAVLDARAAHPGATLADLYDPLTMPPDLVKAHAHLDALVDKAYGLSPSVTDAERVAHLFKLYAGVVNGKKE